MRTTEDANIRPAIEWEPMGKGRRGRPRKIQIDGVRKDLETLDVTNWKDRIQN